MVISSGTLFKNLCWRKEFDDCVPESSSLVSGVIIPIRRVSRFPVRIPLKEYSSEFLWAQVLCSLGIGYPIKPPKAPHLTEQQGYRRIVTGDSGYPVYRYWDISEFTTQVEGVAQNCIEPKKDKDYHRWLVGYDVSDSKVSRFSKSYVLANLNELCKKILLYPIVIRDSNIWISVMILS